MKKINKLTGFELKSELKKELKKPKINKEKTKLLKQLIKKNNINNKKFLNELSCSPLLRLAVFYIKKQGKINQLIINKNNENEIPNLYLILDSIRQIINKAEKTKQINTLNSF